jgi:hypothetical protein
VTADRTVSVETAGDASAFVAITPAETSGSETANADTYVDASGSGPVSIDLTGDDDDSTDLGSGVNQNAETSFKNLLDITNQGNQAIQVGVSEDPLGPIDGGVFAEGPDDNAGSNGNPNFPDPDNDDDQDPGSGFDIADNPVSLEPGDTVQNIGLDINDPSTIPSDGSVTLTIIAMSDSRYEQEYGTPNDN